MAKDINGNEIAEIVPPSASKYANVLDKQSGTVLQASTPQEATLAAFSDNHEVDPNQIFNVKKYDGSVGSVKGSDLKEVLDSGEYKLESSEETQNRKDNEKYGDKSIQAGALGAARGLTFGVSDIIAKESGAYTGDELRGIENANPVASIGGEVVGTLAPALFSGGTSLVAKGAVAAGKGLALSEAVGGLAAGGVKKFAAAQAEKVAVKEIAAKAAEKITMSEAKTVFLVAEEAAAARAAGSTMVAEKTAEGATSLMAKGLEKAGYAGSTAKNIATKMLYGSLKHMAPEAADLAVQGAMQGAGRLVTEDVFGTAEFNAENLISHAGIGALVGGTFGAVIGAGKALIPSAKSAAGFIANKSDELFSKVVDPEAAALRMSELSPSQLSKIEARQPGFSKDYADRVGRILKENTAIKNNVQLQEAVAKKLDDVGADIHKNLEEADWGIRDNLPGHHQSVDTMQRDLTRIKDDFVARNTAGTTPAQREAVLKYGDSYIIDLGERLKDKGSLTAVMMQEEKAALANRAFKTRDPLPDELVINSLQKEFAAEFGKGQEFIVKNAAEFSNTPGLMERYLENKKTFQTLANGSKNADKIKYKAMINPVHWEDIATKDVAVGLIAGGGAAAAIKSARMAFDSFAMQKRLVMGTFDSGTRATANATLKGLNAMAKGASTVAAAAEPSIIRHLVSSEFAVKNSDGKKIKPKNEQEAYANIVENANKAVTDPESVLQHSNRQTAEMFDHAPNTAAAIDAKYLQALQFLASKGKKSNKNTGIFDIGKTSKVSGFETAKMARYLDAITNPKDMLFKASKGRLSREHVEVMENIFPEMHKAMKQTTLDFISKNQTKLKYNQKLQLGLLLGMQPHESMQPQNIQALQAQFEPSAPEQSGSDYNGGAVGDMTTSDTMSTVTQDQNIGD